MATTPGGGRSSPEEIRDRMVTSLGLSEEQQRKLDPILQDMRQQMSALRGAPEAERQQRAASIREAMRTRVREILSPEQRAKFDESAAAGSGTGRSRAATAGRVYMVDEDGKPKAVSLSLGISDGSSTEVLRGDLKEGQEIIVGGGSQRPGTSGTPRLRL